MYKMDNSIIDHLINTKIKNNIKKPISEISRYDIRDLLNLNEWKYDQTILQRLQTQSELQKPIVDTKKRKLVAVAVDSINSQKDIVDPWETNYEIQNTVNDSEWKKVVDSELDKPYFKKLVDKITNSHKPFEGEFKIFPPKHLIFNAFNHTPLCDVKVVVIGQDPYISCGQANGLCFAVNKGVKIPPSLKNIYKELHQDPDVEFATPDHGDLTGWAKQGVLLLNTSLSVREKNAGSHSRFGWTTFTDNVIKHISKNCNGVFL